MDAPYRFPSISYVRLSQRNKAHSLYGRIILFGNCLYELLLLLCVGVDMASLSGLDGIYLILDRFLLFVLELIYLDYLSLVSFLILFHSVNHRNRKSGMPSTVTRPSISREYLILFTSYT